MHYTDTREGMTQWAPFPEELDEMVKNMSYRPGWSFELSNIERDRDHGRGTAGGLTFEVTTLGYDSYHPEKGETYRVRHFFPVPAATYDRRSWRHWIFDCLQKIETHELCEFLQVDGEKPYAPSHGPGNDPYLVREIGTSEDARTSFRGVLKD